MYSYGLSSSTHDGGARTSVSRTSRTRRGEWFPVLCRTRFMVFRQIKQKKTKKPRRFPRTNTDSARPRPDVNIYDNLCGTIYQLFTTTAVTIHCRADDCGGNYFNSRRGPTPLFLRRPSAKTIPRVTVCVFVDSESRIRNAAIKQTTVVTVCNNTVVPETAFWERRENVCCSRSVRRRDIRSIRMTGRRGAAREKERESNFLREIFRFTSRSQGFYQIFLNTVIENCIFLNLI